MISRDKDKHLIDNINNFRDLIMSFQKSRIILTAYELDIFSAIGLEGADANIVANRAGTNVKATERLMNALCAIGLLQKGGNKFFNTNFSNKYLVKDSVDYISGLIHMSSLWERWGNLTEVVKSGKAVIDINIRREKEWTEAFIAAMHDRAKMNALDLVSMIDLSGVSSVLDLGAGSGDYAIAFVRAKEGISVTAFDLPHVISLTKKYVKKENLSDKMLFLEGDYLVDDIGKEYDLIFLSQIIHSNSLTDNQKLIRKCVGALNAGGRIVVQDFIIDESRTEPVQAALFSINMLVGTEAGDTYTENEVSGWLREAGLTKIERKDTNWGTTIIIGQNYS